MTRKTSILGFVLLIGLSFSGCILSSQWSHNLALPTYGAEGIPPALNDGKLDTIATVDANNTRVFTLKFSEIQSVQKVIIRNGNLFWFDVSYLDTETKQWKTFHSVRHRRHISNPYQRDISAQRAQPEFVIDRLDFQTNMIQVNVSRTVDDQIIPKPMREPGDQVVNMRRGIGGHNPFFRIIKPAQAKIREIEVYHLGVQ